MRSILNRTGLYHYLLGVVSAFAFISVVGFARQNQELLTVNVAQAPQGQITFSYLSGLAELIMEKPDPDSPGGELWVARCALAAGNPQNLIIQFEEGPSADPGFRVLRENESGVPTLISGQHQTHYGISALIPGDGALYISGHVNSYFNHRRKFELRDGNIVELTQPFYYVGLESVALTELIMYADGSLTREIYRMQEGEPVTVIINDGENYLVMNRWGITGWWKPDRTGQHATQIRGFFFFGD
jgi:hypothetical protein